MIARIKQIIKDWNKKDRLKPMNRNRKINVLQLTEGLGWAGAEKKLWELVFRMDTSRFNTLVCNFGMGDYFPEQLENLGLRYVTLKRKNQFDISLIWRLRRLIRREKIDVIMSTLFYADFMAALVGKWAGAKAVFSWETISSPLWLVPRRLYPYRTVIKLADRVVSVSQATAKWLVEERGVSPRQIDVIPYGVDLDRFKKVNDPELKKELGLPADAPIVGMVARLQPQKGHIYLFDAAEKILKEAPKTRFVLVGGGPDRDKLEEMVRQKGLDKYFHFLGYRDDVPRVLRIFDIFTLPSLFEGLPNVVLEAMSCSLPVVATPVDGTKEAVVPGETGILVPTKDSAKLANALIALLKDPARAKQLGDNGRKRVENEFSLQLQVSRFEDLYEKWTFRD